MAKMFLPPAEKWGVKISMDKRTITRSSCVQRRVIVHNRKPSNNKKEKWHDDLMEFIVQSKKEINFQAQNVIESAMKWQQNANEKFDMIQRYIDGEHNLQNSSTGNEKRPIKSTVERSTEQRTERQSKQATPRQPKKVCFPSMPVLFTESDSVDDLTQFLTVPPAPLPEASKKITKRRSTVCVSSPDSQREQGVFPIRKISRAVSRIVLTSENSNSQPKTVSKPAEQNSVPSTGNSMQKSNEEASTSSVSKDQPITTAQKADDVFQKFLETRKIVKERQRQKQLEEEARLNGQSGGQSKAD